MSAHITDPHPGNAAIKSPLSGLCSEENIVRARVVDGTMSALFLTVAIVVSLLCGGFLGDNMSPNGEMISFGLEIILFLLDLALATDFWACGHDRSGANLALTIAKLGVKFFGVVASGAIWWSA